MFRKQVGCCVYAVSSIDRKSKSEQRAGNFGDEAEKEGERPQQQRRLVKWPLLNFKKPG